MIDDENCDLVAAASEIQRGRLYFVAFKKNYKPKCTTNTHYFSIDEDFIYENFYNDFGPLNICMLYRYCQKLNTKLNAKCHANKKIIHYTSMNPAKRLNAAYLIGSYAIIYLNKTPEEAYKPLVAGDIPTYTRFCDASYGTSNFKISLIDCLNAVYKAMRAGLFNFDDFDAEEYEYFERVENGDFNWIVPQKFIAFCGPHQKSKTLPNGYPCHAPETYFDYFRENNVTTVIRLNAKVYHASSFENAGFDHKDLFFIDGSTPSDLILKKFLNICETNRGAISVHCKAGLGRTGSLIGAYIMKHYNFTALEAIAWLRLCRPGSVIGHQQQWMEDKQTWLWSEGERLRKRTGTETPVHKYGIYSIKLKELLSQAPEIVKGISQRVDTMHLHDGEELSFQEQQNNLNNNNNNKLMKVRREKPVNIELTDEDDSETNLTSKKKDVVDLAKETELQFLTRRRKTTTVDNNNKSPTPPLRRRQQISPTTTLTPANNETYSSSYQLVDSLSRVKKSIEAAQRPTISSSVRRAQVALEKSQLGQTQGDKLNQIKAMRRQQHNSRALANNSNNAFVNLDANINNNNNNSMRCTRARSQPFRNNASLLNITTTTTTTTSSMSNNNNINNINAGGVAITTYKQQHITNEVDSNGTNTITTTTETTKLINNNNTKIYNNNNNNNDNINNNIITATTTSTIAPNTITTRARSLALYSKRMGIMKQQQQIEQQTNTSKINNRNNNIVDKKPSTTSAGNLSKQNKTLHNQQLLKECHQDEQSKIPVIRATARLMDFATTNSLVGSSATIPPIRNNMRLQHHMLLRGRSRIRYHRRNMGVGVGVGVPTTYTTNNEGRSISASLDTYTNTLPQKEMLGLRFSAPCNKNSNNIILSSLKQKNNNNTNNTSTISSNNNNANDDPTSSDNSYSISSNTSSITRPVIRRHFNANLSSTDTNLLNSQPSSTTTTSGTKNLDDISRTSTSPSSSTSSLILDDHSNSNNNNNANNNNNNNSSSSAGSCCTTVSAIKRNKRSLSSTRIEKDKCDEYNTKLLRKTTPPMGHYANKKTNQINNNNNNNNNNVDKQDGKKLTTTTTKTSKTRTHASCQDVRSITNKESSTSRGGSFKEYSTTSGIPTPIGGLHQRPSHYQLSTK